MTRITHTMRDDRGNVFPVVIEFSESAVALLGGPGAVTAARTAVWIMFGGVALSQHEYVVREIDPDDPPAYFRGPDGEYRDPNPGGD